MPPAKVAFVVLELGAKNQQVKTVSIQCAILTNKPNTSDFMYYFDQ